MIIRVPTCSFTFILQTSTTQSVETNVNVPWMDYLAVSKLTLTGKTSRASTPWGDWKYRCAP